MSEQGRILIIDDNKSAAEEFERVLRSEGYEVKAAATAGGLCRKQAGSPGSRGSQGIHEGAAEYEAILAGRIRHEGVVGVANILGVRV